MSNKLKIMLWKLNPWSSIEKCPICKGELLPHYDTECENCFLYTCRKDECEFNG